MTLGQGVLLAVGAVVLAAISPRPARPDRRPKRVRRPALLRRGRRDRSATPDLAAIDRLLSMSIASAQDEYVRLRPLVRGIARQRLADHTGVRLDTAPEAAEAILGPEVWELVRPDRERPADHHARGIAPDRLRTVVDALERIGAPA
ncbi:MAG: hypothetical protein ABJB93_02590 [Gaiellales bacterium]